MKIKLLILSLLCLSLWAKEPDVLYLTWKDDPSTTMMVFWQTIGNGPQSIHYQEVGENDWHFSKAKGERLDSSGIWVYSTELSHLQPDTLYRLRFEEGEPIHLFRTLPDNLDRSLKVVIGGDALLDEKLFKKMNHLVASMGPDFVIMGGDIAYTEGLRRALKKRDWQAARWMEFFKDWTEQMVAPDGRMIPIVPVIGNHDVREGYDDPNKKKVLFFQVFAFPNPDLAYRVMSVAGVDFFLLDSGHCSPVVGEQSQWLEKALEVEALYKIPVYHIAAYPSVYSFSHASSQEIRNVWVPLFEKAGVRVAFENDNHAFKRTYPIKEGKINPEGIIFLGDGSWGVPPRKPRSTWYLEKSSQVNCVWLLTFTSERCTCEAFNIKGKKIDELSVKPASEGAMSSAQ